MSGLTVNGFEAKRLVDIQEELAAALVNTFGEVDTSADSVFGQIIGVLSKPLADLWEELEHVYFSQYPDTANGLPLDYAVALTGITRNPATFSEGVIALKATDGTVVPGLTQIKQSVTGILFQTKADTLVTLTSVASVIISIDAAVEGQAYDLTIDGIPCPYTAAPGKTKAEIATALAASIVAEVPTLVEVTDYHNGAFLITAKATAVTLVVDADNESWWTPAEIIALDKGAIPAPEGTLIEIVNAVSGLDAVYNFEAIDLDSRMGRDIETDEALRTRRLATLHSAGAGTVDAIRSRLLDEVDGVTNAYVFENDQDIEVDGRPPHCIECVVAGGTDRDIAYEIWKIKAGGIRTFGHTSFYPVVDSQGNQHTIEFSRPFERKAWVIAIFTKTSEEDFPVGGETQIQDNLVEYGNGLVLGNDLFYQRFFAPIYAVAGVASVTLYISLPRYEYDIVGTLANLEALLDAMEAEGGFVFANNDTFYVDGTGDTTSGALATAKGSAPAAGDCFKVTNRATPAISYLGNLITPLSSVPNYGAYVQANISVFGTEYASFLAERTTVVEA